MFGSYNKPGAGSAGVAAPIGSWSSSLRYEDMKVSTGGVSRNTEIGGTYTNLYSVTGAGLFVGFLLNLESLFVNGWDIQLVIDGNTIFTLNTDVTESNNLYDFDNSSNAANNHLGIDLSQNAFRWRGPMQFPVQYTTSIVVKARWTGPSTRQFEAGLAVRSV